MLTLKTNHEADKTDIEADVAKEAAKVKKAPAKKAPAKKVTKKTPTKGRATKKTKTVNRGGGRALSDFTNSAKIKVVKRDFARVECFRTGQTVEQNLAAQKEAGFRGRRKFIRKQIAMKRIVVS